MPKAMWNGVVLAESQQTIMVEGSHYFPRCEACKLRPGCSGTRQDYIEIHGSDEFQPEH